MALVRHLRARRADQRGVALVEFAIALPVLAILVMGVVDLGRAYALSSRLSNAAREGARFGQFAPEQVAVTGVCLPTESITWYANHEDGANAWTVSVDRMNGQTATPITGCKTMQDPAATVFPGARIRVRVSTSFSVLTPLVGALVGNQITMTRSQEVVVQGR